MHHARWAVLTAAQLSGLFSTASLMYSISIAAADLLLTVQHMRCCASAALLDLSSITGGRAVYVESKRLVWVAVVILSKGQCRRLQEAGEPQ